MRISVIFLFCIFLNAQELETILEKGIEKSYKLKSYNHLLSSKNKVLKQSKDKYLPTVTLDASLSKDKYYYKYPNYTQKYNSFIKNYSITIIQPIYQADIFNFIKDSRLKLKYVKLQKLIFKQQLYKDISILYISLITSKKIMYWNQLKQENFHEILKNINEKLKYHFSTMTDKYQAQAKYISAKNDYLYSKLTFDNSMKKLFFYTGINNLKINKAIKNDIYILVDDSNLNILNNPSLRLAKLNQKIAFLEVQKRKNQFSPTLNLEGSYSDEISSDSITRRHNYKISLNFKMNLFNKATNDSVDEAKELYQKAKYDYLDVLNTAKMNLEKAKYGVKTYLEILKKDKAIIKNTQEYLNKAQISYENKLISLNDLYKAENDYYSALIQFEKDKNSLLQSYIYVYFSIGQINKDIIKNIENFIK